MLIFRIAEVHISGEWWIIDGSAQYADGDTGDMNHEAYVIDAVRAQYVGDEMEDVDWEDFEQKLFKDKIRETNQSFADNESYYRERLKIIDAALKELGMSDEEIKIARGEGDGRLYGAREWGWKRMEGRNIETFTLTSDDLQSIANGIYDAYFDGENEENIANEEFYIYVYSNKKWYHDIPFSVISKGNPMALREFERFS